MRGDPKASAPSRMPVVRHGFGVGWWISAASPDRGPALEEQTPGFNLSAVKRQQKSSKETLLLRAALEDDPGLLFKGLSPVS